MDFPRGFSVSVSQGFEVLTAFFEVLTEKRCALLWNVVK